MPKTTSFSSSASPERLASSARSLFSPGKSKISPFLTPPSSPNGPAVDPEVILAAIEDGSATASQRRALGLYYAQQGGEENLQKSFEYLMQSANQGNCFAAHEVAIYLICGKGVEPDFDWGLRYLRMAIREGNNRAKYDLACCYLNGTGVEKSEREALRTFESIAHEGYTDDKGYDLVTKRLASYFLQQGDKTKATLYYARMINGKETEISEEERGRIDEGKNRIRITDEDVIGKNTILNVDEINEVIAALKKAEIGGRDEIVLGLVDVSKSNLWPHDLANIYEQLSPTEAREKILPLIARKIEYCVKGMEGDYPQVKASVNEDKTFNVEVLDSPSLFTHVQSLVGMAPINLVAEKLKIMDGVKVFSYDEQKEQSVFRVAVEGVAKEELFEVTPKTSAGIRVAVTLTDAEKSRANYLMTK